jgi:hypothetical protein
MKNNIINSNIVICILWLLTSLCVNAVENEQNEPSLIKIECKHIVKKIDIILNEIKLKKHTNDEIKILMKYLESSYESLNILINTEKSLDMIFKDINSDRAKTDLKMWSNMKLGKIHIAFSGIHDTTDNEKFPERLASAKLALTELSDLLPY